jgi:hypothetical protein
MQATRSETQGAALNGLGDALRRELQTARTRLEQAAARRAALERELHAAAAAEAACRQAVAALEAVAHEGAEVMPGLVDEAQLSTDGPQQLAGAQLRERLARAALRRGAAGRPLHWSVWWQWLQDDGFDAAGKKPEATFLTQLSRSPLVRRGPEEGHYVLDLDLVDRNRERLLDLHEQVSRIPPPDQLALLGDIRAQRRILQSEVSRVERALEEAWRVLAKELPDDAPHDAKSPSLDWLVEAWKASDRDA